MKKISIQNKRGISALVWLIVLAIVFIVGIVIYYFTVQGIPVVHSENDDSISNTNSNSNSIFSNSEESSDEIPSPPGLPN